MLNTTNQPTPAEIPDRRFQYSLRTILLVTMLAGCGLGWLGVTVRDARQQEIDAKNSVSTTVEIGTMEIAFKAYKERYGSYPPSDFTNLDDADSPQYKALYLHIAKAFPRCNVEAEIAAIKKFGVGSPAQSLCLWLRGFSDDPEHPISKLLDVQNANHPFFPFDPVRLRYPAGESGCPVYLPKGRGDAPYVFFSSVNYATQAPFTADVKQGGRGIARPYRADRPAKYEFMNPNSFQIVSAGADGDYGGGNGSYPSGDGYEAGDNDNLANFAPDTLRDAMPY